MPLAHRSCRAAAVLAFALAAGAAQAAASTESVERLMQAMQLQRQLETMQTQTLPMLQNAMRQSIARQVDSPEKQRAIDATTARVNALLREELSWSRLKPAYAVVYAETFSQDEVDGLIAFYQGPIGQALVAKTPQLTQRSALIMQERMAPLMHKVLEIAREEVQQALPAAGAKR